ncbi:helicase [Oceanobacillus sp. CFH 90083]|uniref:helicase n=1 Tax=Oceanobacillus sp. CFH 90083 TaxID=2592336 RepID=UPI001D132CEF|nr:helicase [Oceanobacillus sp. CFH 90083]
MTKGEKKYHDCDPNIKIIKAGGYTKSELLQKMKENKIFLNELAEQLLASKYFEVSKKHYQAKVIELAVKDLGCIDGATTSRLFSKAADLKLEPCPLELAPYVRLAYLNQAEGYDENQLQHRAPYGSITIASKIFSEDVSVPKGFYLRRIQGNLWLRGYIADEEHVWNPDDHFIFCIAKK